MPFCLPTLADLQTLIIPSPPQLSLEDSLQEAIAAISGGDCGCVVISQPEGFGLLNAEDVVRLLAQGQDTRQPLATLDISPAPTLKLSDWQDIDQIGQYFLTEGVRHLLIVDDRGNLEGVISQDKWLSLLTPHGDIKKNLEPFFTLTLNLLCIADVQGRFIRLNPAWETTLGYQTKDLEGQILLDFVHPEDRAATLAAIEQLKGQEKVEGFLNRYRRADGGYVYLEWYAQPYGSFLYAVAQDITQQKEIEETLKKREAHLQTAQRIAHLGSWEFEVATGKITWSDQVFRLLGRDIALGMPSYEEVLQIYHPEDQIVHDRVVTEAIATGKPYDLECRVCHEDGPYTYIQARGEPIMDAKGQVTALVGTILDITDRKTHEADLLRVSQQLAASNQELEAFAYSVSHDLRAPLRAIDGFSQALLEDYGQLFDDIAQDYFDRIRFNISRMSNLIDDLLSLSRVSRSELKPQWVNLSALAANLSQDLQIQEPQRRVEFIIAPDLKVTADPTLMAIVLTNLLENAWKFTSHHPSARIELGVMPGETTPVYFVRDDGAGFDMQYAKMLFGVFQRLHNTAEFPGTGIGLATVQRIIRRHGGKIWAEGAIEQGATFYFTIP
ncbi:PAS domain-containing protein [Spirulina subsalsa]|uniref:PAS domain-containing protein n=1 Tax=Spirulina subsalsa TaxID=54311 RepID=UPI00030C9342|nr:PAS domain-containing protein [Spirulina subsalsa]